MILLPYTSLRNVLNHRFSKLGPRTPRG